MKYLILIVAVTFSYCSKSGTTTKCYTCEVMTQTPQGLQPVYHDVCTNQIDTVEFKDQNGNQQQSVCTEK